MTIYDASMRYQAAGVPLIVLAGKEYGSGSSRDWAAKGPHLLGVRAVIAESYERIHRSNLIGMGILPLAVHGRGVGGRARPDRPRGRSTSSAWPRPWRAGSRAASNSGARHARGRRRASEFTVTVRIDTPQEVLLLPARRHPALRAAPAPEPAQDEPEVVSEGHVDRGRPGDRQHADLSQSEYGNISNGPRERAPRPVVLAVARSGGSLSAR